MKDTIQWEAERGSKLTGADIGHAHTLRSKAWDNMRLFQEKYEYFITPTTQLPPFDVTQPYPTEVAGVKMSTYIEWMNILHDDFSAREPLDFDALRLHRRRPAGWAADCRPSSRRVERAADGACVRASYARFAARPAIA